jgi:hypothetical protein
LRLFKGESAIYGLGHYINEVILISVELLDRFRGNVWCGSGMVNDKTALGENRAVLSNKKEKEGLKR